MSKIRCFIGLGSNLDNPLAHVSSALKELAAIDNCILLNQSSLYRSAPVGPQDQPDFVNAVAELATTLDAHQLLDALQALEQQHQRVRERHWGPRTLDLDLLIYGNDVISTERLTVPHAYLHERNFVLYPLAEIDPHLDIPNLGSISGLLATCPMGSLIKI